MSEPVRQKLNNKFLTIICMLLLGVTLLILGGCGGKEKPDKVFAKELTRSSSYKVEGLMESYYDTGRKRNDFMVLYKNPGLIKVVIKPEGSNDKQIILKNSDGVYILIPAVNKNFKIQSDWPENASYPYLLQSLAKDIANDPEVLTTEDENTFTVETKTKMHADAVLVKQKIIFNKDTNLPTEVLVYDENDNLYIRTVFSNINLNYNISDDEFDLENSMTTVRIELGDGIAYEGREIAYPRYCPEGVSLLTEKTTQNTERTEVLSIMVYGNEPGFTIIQEFVNDQEAMRYQEEKGDILMVMGVWAILKTNSISLFFNGIEYTVASDDLTADELIKIIQSFMTTDEK